MYKRASLFSRRSQIFCYKITAVMNQACFITVRQMWVKLGRIFQIFSRKKLDWKWLSISCYSTQPRSASFRRKTFDRKTFGRKTFDRKTFDWKTFDRKTFDQKTFDRKTFDRKTFDRNTFDRKTFDQHNHDQDIWGLCYITMIIYNDGI